MAPLDTESHFASIISDRHHVDLYQVLFEQSSDPHLLLDDSGVIECNRAAIAMLGVTDKQQILKLHPADFSPKYQPDGRLSQEKCVEMNSLAHQNGSHRFDWIHTRADGENFLCEVTLTPVQLPTGSAMLVVWHDLSARMEQQRKLALCQFTLEHLDSDVAWVRRDGTISYVNNSLCDRTGYSREELLQMQPYQIDPSFSPERVRQVFDKTRLQGGMMLETEPRRKDGSHYSSLVNVTYIHQGEEAFLCVIGQDISEQKRQQQSLVKIQTRLENALAGGNVGLWDWQIQENNVYVSPELNKQLGEEPNSWSGIDDFNSRLHPDDSQAAMQRLEDVFSGKLKEYESTFRLRHVDGSYRWILSRGQLFRDDQGEPLRMIGVHVDITERIAAEKALEHSERNFRELAENIAEVFWITSSDGQHLHYISPAFEQIWGRPRETLVDFPAQRNRVIHEDDRQRMHLAFFSPNDCGAFDEEYRIVRPDGEVRWIRDRGFPIYDDQGNVQRIAGLAEDITTQKNDQRRVARELERHTVMLRTLELALSVSSIDQLTEFVTQEARMLVDANQGMTKFSRTNQWQQTVYGISLSDKYASYRRTRYVLDGSGISGTKLKLRRSVRKTQAELEALEDFRPPNPDDRFPPLRGWLACPLIGRDGSDLGLIQLSDKCDGEFDSEDQALLVQFSFVVALAIERLRVEESLRRQSDFLQQSNQDLEQFAYVASHDLQEPLRAISGYCEFLKEDYGDQLDQQGIRFIDVTISAADRMKRLIDALLQFSRVSRDKSDFEEVDLNDVLDEVKTKLRVPIQRAKASLKSLQLPRITGNRGQLSQLFEHLIDNAINYRSERPLEIYIDSIETPDGWTIRMHDNGIGVGPDFQEEIFRVFRRLHDRNEIDGTGIGLAICKCIVERHGGRIWVESTEGRGSVFLLEIKRPTNHDVEM